MGTSKSDKELREETRARRAKHDLKNTPLPLKRRGSPGSKKLFSDRKSESNRLMLSRLTNRRIATGLVHSKSMSDLREDMSSGLVNNVTNVPGLSRSKSVSNISSQHSASCGDLLKYIGGGGRYKVSCQHLIDKYTSRPSSVSSYDVSTLGRYSKSCSDLTFQDPSLSNLGLRRSKSYSRINDERSAYDLKTESYRSTIRNIFTNLKDFSSRTVSAISSDRAVRGLRFSSVNDLPEPSSLSSSYSSSVNKSLSKLPTDLSTDFSKKSFRQMKLSNTFLSAGTSSISSYIGNSYRQYSSNFSSTTSASKSRFSNVRSVFAC